MVYDSTKINIYSLELIPGVGPELFFRESWGEKIKTIFETFQWQREKKKKNEFPSIARQILLVPKFTAEVPASAKDLAPVLCMYTTFIL